MGEEGTGDREKEGRKPKGIGEKEKRGKNQIREKGEKFHVKQREIKTV